MSGFLTSAISTVGGIASTITDLFGGSPVSIGDVDLNGFEVPDQVTWGGEQTLVTHKFPGGAKTIDAIGYYADNISWSGRMLGSGAIPRARELDQIAQDGEPVEMSFSDFSYYVVVKKFAADYKRSNWIGEYRIECEILPDDPSASDKPSALEDGTVDQASIGGALKTDDPASGASLSVADGSGAANGWTVGPEFQMKADVGIPQVGGTGSIVPVQVSGFGLHSILHDATAMLPAATNVLKAASVAAAFIPGGSACTGLIAALGAAQAATSVGVGVYDNMIGAVSAIPSVLASPLGFSVAQAALGAQSAVLSAGAAVGRTLSNLTGRP